MALGVGGGRGSELPARRSTTGHSHSGGVLARQVGRNTVGNSAESGKWKAVGFIQHRRLVPDQNKYFIKRTLQQSYTSRALSPGSLAFSEFLLAVEQMPLVEMIHAK